MKPHDINDKFMELSTVLENFAEGDIKNLVACVHVLWLTDDEPKQQEALKALARIASQASDAYQAKHVSGYTTDSKSAKITVFDGGPSISTNFDLSTWNPGTDKLQ